MSNDKRTESIGDIRLSVFRRVEQYDSIIDWAVKFWRVNKKALLIYALISLVSFGIGYTAFAALGWWHTFLIWAYLIALSVINLAFGAFLMFAAMLTKMAN